MEYCKKSSDSREKNERLKHKKYYRIKYLFCKLIYKDLIKLIKKTPVKLRRAFELTDEEIKEPDEEGFMNIKKK